MAKETKPPLIVETIPSVQKGLSAIASSHAPVVFFDHVSNFGTYNGIAHITLIAMRFLPGDDGQARHDNMVAAHLRMNIPAMRALREALDGIEELLKPPEATQIN